MNSYLLPKEQQQYTFGQPWQIAIQTGLIGQISANVGKEYDPNYLWRDIVKAYNTPEFLAARTTVFQALAPMMQNIETLRRNCIDNKSAAFDDQRHYGLRIDEGNYSFLFRLNPEQPENNVQCYCYVREWLDRHCQKAHNGIRFITSRYQNLFFLPDGGKVAVSNPDGKRGEYTARYIDDTHVELESGGGSSHLFHICELAERLERGHQTVTPVTETMPPRSPFERDQQPQPWILPGGGQGAAQNEIEMEM